MNRKQLGILVVLVVILGTAGLVLYRNENASWHGSNAGIGQKLLADLPINDVVHVAVRQGTNELNLVKQDDQWRVRERYNYPADFSQISEFLRKARELKVVQMEEVGPSQLGRLNLAPGQGSNSALTVTFEGQNDKPIKTLLLGKSHVRQPSGASITGGEMEWPDGRYVKLAESANVAVISDPLENIQPKPDAWLDKDFIRVEKAKSVAVTFPVATNSWKLTRDSEGGDWKLADAKPGEELDSSKSAATSNPLGSASFNDVRPGAALPAGGNHPPTIIRIDTFDGFNYTVNVGQKTNDDYPVTVQVAAQLAKERTPGKDEKAEDKARLDKEFKEKLQKLEEKLKQEQSYEKWTYLVSTWTMDPLLKERSQLLSQKKAEPKKEELSGTNSMSKAESAAAPAASAPSKD